MNESNPLAERERALENAFFQKENARLIEQMHIRREHEADLNSLGAALELPSQALLEALLGLGVREQNIAALMLAPLVVLAWTDGTVDEAERQAIRRAEAEHGIPESSEAARLLDVWLAHRPHDSLLGLWASYAHALSQRLSDRERKHLQTDILSRARRLTGSLRKSLLRAGGPTEAELNILFRVEAAFELDGFERGRGKSSEDEASKEPPTIDQLLRSMT